VLKRGAPKHFSKINTFAGFTSRENFPSLPNIKGIPEDIPFLYIHKFPAECGTIAGLPIQMTFSGAFCPQ
jgi:hypothetical protein